MTTKCLLRTPYIYINTSVLIGMDLQYDCGKFYIRGMISSAPVMSVVIYAGLKTREEASKKLIEITTKLEDEIKYNHSSYCVITVD